MIEVYLNSEGLLMNKAIKYLTERFKTEQEFIEAPDGFKDFRVWLAQYVIEVKNAQGKYLQALIKEDVEFNKQDLYCFCREVLAYRDENRDERK